MEDVKISIYGAGAFGYAICYQLQRKYFQKTNSLHKDENLKINLNIHDPLPNIQEPLKKNRQQPFFFQGHELVNEVNIIDEVSELITDADIVFLAIPSQFMRISVKKIKPYLKKNAIIITVAKGIEIEKDSAKSKLMHTVIKEEITNDNPILALAGGMIAQNVIDGGPLGAEIASNDMKSAEFIQKLLSDEHLRLYVNQDITGVELSGALKNVISIGAGIIDGMKLPLGSKTFLISRATRELKKIGMSLDAKNHTFTSQAQAFGNDLWMSSMGQTRNHYFGTLLGSGKSVQESLKQLENEHKTAEGYMTSKAIMQLIKELKLDLPIFESIHEILHEQKPADTILEKYLKSELTHVDH